MCVGGGSVAVPFFFVSGALLTRVRLLVFCALREPPPVPVPNITSIADGLPTVASNNTLAAALDELNALPSFSQIRDDILADWANVSSDLNQQVTESHPTEPLWRSLPGRVCLTPSVVCVEVMIW